MIDFDALNEMVDSFSDSINILCSKGGAECPSDKDEIVKLVIGHLLATVICGIDDESPPRYTEHWLQSLMSLVCQKVAGSDAAVEMSISVEVFNEDQG